MVPRVTASITLDEKSTVQVSANRFGWGDAWNLIYFPREECFIHLRDDQLAAMEAAISSYREHKARRMQAEYEANNIEEKEREVALAEA
jgi:hypothetical protein